MDLTKIILMYNTDIARSETDARTYIARRGLPVNLIGVNFGNTSAPVLEADWVGGVYTVQHYEWDGVVIPDYNGENIVIFINDVLRGLVEGFIMSTCCPYRFDNDAGLQPPLEGWIARNNGLGSIPFGKLGCNPAQNNYYGDDQLTDNGQYCVDRATLNALAAETECNFDKLHIIGSNYNDTTRGFTPTWVANTFTPAAVAGGLTLTSVQAGVTVGLSTPNGWQFDPWKSASNTPGYAKPEIFGWNAPAFNTNSTDLGGGGGGSFPFSNSYTVAVGGFVYPWYSNPGNLRMDFLYHGGSAAFGCVSEPLDTGLCDPNYVQQYLLQGLSCMEARNLAATLHPPFPNYGPGIPTQREQFFSTVYGDPLYAPYKVQTRTLNGARPFIFS